MKVFEEIRYNIRTLVKTWGWCGNERIPLCSPQSILPVLFAFSITQRQTHFLVSIWLTLFSTVRGTCSHTDLQVASPSFITLTSCQVQRQTSQNKSDLTSCTSSESLQIFPLSLMWFNTLGGHFYLRIDFTPSVLPQLHLSHCAFQGWVAASSRRHMSAIICTDSLNCTLWPCFPCHVGGHNHFLARTYLLVINLSETIELLQYGKFPERVFSLLMPRAKCLFPFNASKRVYSVNEP